MIRVALVFTVSLLGGCSCDDPTLVETANDGGDTATDAGAQPDDDEDAGPQRDAGALDAGYMRDAGSADDAGSRPDGGGIVVVVPDDGGTQPTCALDERTIFDFTCEGDEDMCDPAGDVEVPEQDVVAVWTHFEGDELVIDIRFRARPFTMFRLGLSLYLTPIPYETEGQGDIHYVFPEGFSPELLVGGMQLLVVSSLTEPTFFPPVLQFAPDPLEAIDPCATVFFATDAPAMQLRFLMSPNQFESYFFTSERLINGAEDADYLFAGTSPAMIPPAGGAPDTAMNFESICSVTCESIGGTSSP